MSKSKGSKFISAVVNIILYVTLIGMIGVVISSKASGGEPNFMGYQLKSVLSGSMEPTFMTGSIIAINPDIDANNLKEGEVITFKRDSKTLVTHRIVEVIEQGSATMYKTKGDNNDAADGELVLPANIVGVYTDFTIPFIGYFMNFANSQMGTVLLLIVPGVLLMGYAVILIRQALKSLDTKTVADESSKNV